MIVSYCRFMHFDKAAIKTKTRQIAATASGRKLKLCLMMYLPLQECNCKAQQGHTYIMKEKHVKQTTD